MAYHSMLPPPGWFVWFSTPTLFPTARPGVMGGNVRRFTSPQFWLAGVRGHVVFALTCAARLPCLSSAAKLVQLT